MIPRTWGLPSVLALALGLSLTGAVEAAGERPWCHRVGPGETLATIAGRYRTTVAELQRLNRPGPHAIPRPRRILALPPGLVQLPLVAVPGRLARESAAAARDGLSRMRSARMIERFRRSGLLVPVPEETTTYYVSGVRSGLRVSRPWVRIFLQDLGEAFHRFSGDRLRATSLTRTTVTQTLLRRTNPSAAPAEGPVQSTHLTGAAVDLSTRDLTEAQTLWLRTALDRLRRRGLVQVAEELGQPHFHVMVRRRYAGPGRRQGVAILPPGC